jgi:hypothetical protein
VNKQAMMQAQSAMLTRYLGMNDMLPQEVSDSRL